jgi:regulator of replication initiation timing|tara:strand:+ start:214 stop:471 length:258 start_codon:yes stop_codon:yes gene_type:complete
MMHFDEIKKMKEELETLNESVSELISENASLKRELEYIKNDLDQSLRITGDVLRLHKMIVDTAQFIADREQLALGDIADFQFNKR